MRILDLFELPYDININKVVEYIFNQRFKGTSTGKRVFDYQEDFDLIYACFKRHYGIDLIDDDLDWWKFTTMLDDILSTETSLSKRVEIRGKKIPKANKNNREYINHLQSMKTKYRLSNNQSKEEVQKGLSNIFNFLKTKAKGG